MPLSLEPIAPGADQLFAPSNVVPFALVFHATVAGCIDTAFPISEPNCAYRFRVDFEICAFCGFGNSVSGILSNPVAFSPLLLVPTLMEDDED